MSPEFRNYLIALGELELGVAQKAQPDEVCIQAAQRWRQRQTTELQALNDIAQRAKSLMPDSIAARNQFMGELNSNIDLQYFLTADRNGPCGLLSRIIYFGMESPKQFIVMCRMLHDLM